MNGIHVAVVGADGLARALQESHRFEHVHAFSTLAAFKVGIAGLSSLPTQKLVFLFADNTPNDVGENTVGDLVGRLAQRGYRVAVLECSPEGRNIVTKHPGAGLIPAPVSLNIVLGALSDRGLGLIEPVSEKWAFETLQINNPNAVEALKALTGESGGGLNDIWGGGSEAPGAGWGENHTATEPSPWGGAPAQPAWEQQPAEPNPWGGAPQQPAQAEPNPWGGAPEPSPWGGAPAQPAWEQQPAQPEWGQQPAPAQPAQPEWGQQPVEPNPWGGAPEPSPWGGAPAQPAWGQQPAPAQPAQPEWGQQPAPAQPAWGQQPVEPNPWGGATQQSSWGQQGSQGLQAAGWEQQPAQPAWEQQNSAQVLPTSRRRGFVISVCVAKGGAGKSSLTLNLGVWLGLRLRATGRNVCVVDANWQQADIGKQINAYTPNIYGLSQHAREHMHPAHIGQYLYHRQDLGNTSFLLGPARVEEANPMWINAQLYSNAVEVLRQLFDYVIIDTPVAEFHHELFTDFIIPQSDFLVVPVIPNWPTFLNTDTWLRAITLPSSQGGHGFDERRIGIILNRAEADVGIDEKDVQVELSSWEYLGAVPNSSEWVRSANENEIIATRNYAEINHAFANILYRVTGEEVLLEGLNSGESEKKTKRGIKGLFGR